MLIICSFIALIKNISYFLFPNIEDNFVSKILEKQVQVYTLLCKINYCLNYCTKNIEKKIYINSFYKIIIKNI